MAALCCASRQAYIAVGGARITRVLSCIPPDAGQCRRSAVGQLANQRNCAR